MGENDLLVRAWLRIQARGVAAPPERRLRHAQTKRVSCRHYLFKFLDGSVEGLGCVQLLALTVSATEESPNMQRAFRLFAVFALAVSTLALTSPAQAATPTACNGIPATITGTPGNDTLSGTPGDDVILGLGGADVIDGGGGNDVICGGSGDDTIKGGDGADVAYGAAGNDDLAGGNGEDDLFGGPGDDTLRGNQDNDSLIGGAGNDLLNGGYGDDTMRGNDGDDRGFGGPGTDYAEGGPGADNLSGADDDDDLRGNGGDDMLAGEGGDDLLYGGADSDTADGGIGFDRCMGTEFPIDCEDDDLNDPPVAMNDEFDTNEDQATRGMLLLDNGNGEDYDPNGHPLAVVAVDGDENEVGQPLTLPSGAEIMVDADGSFTYDPNGMYEHLNVGSFAVDTFEYTISDPKGETGTATVAVMVDGVNDGPVAKDDEAATNEDEPVAIDVLLNDIDVDSSIGIDAFTPAHERRGRAWPRWRRLRLHPERELLRRPTASPTPSPTVSSSPRQP